MKIKNNMLDFHGTILFQYGMVNPTFSTQKVVIASKESSGMVWLAARDKTPYLENYLVTIEPGSRHYPLADTVEAIPIDELGQGQQLFA